MRCDESPNERRGSAWKPVFQHERHGFCLMGLSDRSERAVDGGPWFVELPPEVVPQRPPAESKTRQDDGTPVSRRRRS